MMMRMYKFQCKPNHPVSDGIIIFALNSSTGYCNLEDAMGWAQIIAEKEGFYYPKEDATIEYLGTFMPHDEQPNPYIITAISGEY